MTRTTPDPRILEADTYADGDPTTFGLPLDEFAYLQNEAPCYPHEFNDPLLIERAWIVTRYADAFAIDRDSELYAADRGYVNIWRIAPVDHVNGGVPALLTVDGEPHKRQRGVMGRAFTPATVKKLEAKFRTYAAAIVDEALQKRTFNFVHDIAHLMPMEALGDVLGVPRADRVKFFSWVDTIAAPFDTRITPSFDSVVAATGELMAYAEELRDLKRHDLGDDVMSKIVEAGEHETLSTDEIMGNVFLLAAGAAESTRAALSHGMHELMRNPEQMAWLREHADDIPATAIQEIIRIASPFTHFVRTATRDHELHGQEIKEGDLVLMHFAAANFDPREFEEPRLFNLARDPNPHLGFGRGLHACLGKHVAGLEMKVLFEELLRRTRDIVPAGEISYLRDAFSRGVYELPVTVTPA
jgi:cytochrome P450